MWKWKLHIYIDTSTEVIQVPTFLMLNSTEHETFYAHKC